MSFCAWKCDNVTTCDNLLFLGCHVVSACFCGKCDNVTTKTPSARTCAPAPAHMSYTLSHMSQCHINKEIKYLECDNLKHGGCHVVTPSEDTGLCSGRSWMITTWCLMLVTRLARLGHLTAWFIRLGHLIGLFLGTGTSKCSCWGAVEVRLMQLLCVLLTSWQASRLTRTKKVLLRGGQYGVASREVSLVSRYFFGVSFRFCAYKTGI